MATKDIFTTEEWELLRKSPFMAGLFIANASPSGVMGTAKEMFAVGKVLAKATAESAAPLLEELAADFSNPVVIKQIITPEMQRTPNWLQSEALESCRQAAGLLDGKLSAADAVAFKQWLLSVGQRVAEASTEGGFLGFGGTRVSDAEARALKELATALGITASS